jgi:hypothetical protein
MHRAFSHFYCDESLGAQTPAIRAHPNIAFRSSPSKWISLAAGNCQVDSLSQARDTIQFVFIVPTAHGFTACDRCDVYK